MLRRTRMRLLAAAAVIGGIACAADPMTAVTHTAAMHDASSGHSLITCSVDQAQSATAIIGPLGGVLSAGNSRVVIPEGAVSAATTFTLTVPASRYVEIEVTADGGEHYVFALPVTVALDYSRCKRSDLDQTPLTAWNIDPASKVLLEAMVGVDDKSTHVVTFSTIHFSGYAVAD